MRFPEDNDRRVWRPSPASGNDLVASRIFLESLGKKNSLNWCGRLDELTKRLRNRSCYRERRSAQCGRKDARSRIAILGVEGLGIDRVNKFGDSEIIRALVRRGAVVSV